MNLTKNIQQMTAEIDKHRAADLLVQGRYYNPDQPAHCADPACTPPIVILRRRSVACPTQAAGVIKCGGGR